MSDSFNVYIFHYPNKLAQCLIDPVILLSHMDFYLLPHPPKLSELVHSAAYRNVVRSWIKGVYCNVDSSHD